MPSSRTFRYLIPLLAAFLLTSSCDEEDTDRDVPPLLDELPAAVFDDESTPRVELPEDDAERAALSPPLAQIGGDSGAEGLTYAAALGGYYIMRTQLANGSFNYRFDPNENTWADEDSLARQCGATYTLSYLYAVTQREEFRIAAEWSSS